MERITAGPDGNLWATLFCDDAVYRIRPSDGQATRFPIPTAGGCPTGLAAGPDGNVWFTEHYRNKVGRITPDGVVTEFRVGPVDSGNPDRIVNGSDGNLWFTGGFLFLHRITPSGAITEFPVGSGVSLAAGQDGYLWSDGYDAISRTSVLGVPRTLPLPDSDHRALDITSGPDGSVWFVEAYTNAIGRILPGSHLSVVAPCRVLDTRGPDAPSLSANVSRQFRVAGRCAVPASVTAVAVNVTVANPSTDGYLVLHATDDARPATSNVNYRRSQARANNAIIAVGSDGMISVFCGQEAGTADLVLDVVGYFP
jgi:hypothetical protein